MLAFYATRSRVVRLHNLPAHREAFLAALFVPHNKAGVPVPVSVWERMCGGSGVFAVFQTHEEAAAALLLSGSAMSVDPATEPDLEPFHSLRRVHYTQPEYTLSTNPPNPKNSFRHGDWICPSPKCAAHNFGRNLACIGCGCPRSAPQQPTALQQQPSALYARPPPSPRFNPGPSTPGVYYSSGPLPSLPLHPQQPQQQQQQQSQTQTHSNPPKPTHPLLTPSGRAFAVGGRVQNISSDPLNPCIMYWPDNEAFPDQGQIRPSHVAGVPQPPILNTGNRGPISHQPGDWICQKCNYLNWRRRKVCQTCLPYAEGNGDSISAAVQAERIALLTSVLTQAQAAPQLLHHSPEHLTVPPAHTPRSHSLTPPQVRRPFIDISPPQPPSLQPSRSVHRSQSHFALGQKYAANQNTLYATSSPIYQTSGHRQPSPLYSTGPTEADSKRGASGAFNVQISSPHDSSVPAVRAPAPLLPSFLQDIVQSPSLSPTSTTTSSVDISSLEDYDDASPSRTATTNFPRVRGNSGSDTGGPIGNIWRLDGEESKALSGFPLPRFLAAKASQERLPL